MLVCLLIFCAIKAFRFLALPAEMRNVVYRITLIPTTPQGVKAAVPTLAPPPLACVNQQLRAESLPVFYGENEFAIHIGPPLSDRSSMQSSIGIRLWAAYQRFIVMFQGCSAAAHGTSYISYIKRISITYDCCHTGNITMAALNPRHKPRLSGLCSLLETTPRSSIGLHMGLPMHPSSHRLRKSAVREIMKGTEATALRSENLRYRDLWVAHELEESRNSFGRLATILRLCTNECPLAAQHVEWWIDFGSPRDG